MATSTGTTGAKDAKPSSVEAVLDALRHHPDATAAELAERTGIGRSTASRTLANLEADGRVTRQRGTSEAGGRIAPDRWTLLSDPPGPASRVEPEPVTEQEPAAEPASTTDPASQGQDEDEDEDHSGQAGAQAAPPATATADTATADTATADTATATATDGEATKGEAEATTAATDGAQPTSKDADTTSSPRLRPGALRALVHAWLAERPGQAFTPTRIGKELGRSAGAVGNALTTMTDAGEVVQTSTKPRAYMVAAQPDRAAETDTSTATKTARAS